MSIRYLHKTAGIITLLSFLWLSFFSIYHHHDKGHRCHSECCKLEQYLDIAGVDIVPAQEGSSHECLICEFLKYNLILTLHQKIFSFEFFISQLNPSYAFVAEEVHSKLHEKSRSPPAVLLT